MLAMLPERKKLEIKKMRTLMHRFLKKNWVFEVVFP